MLDAYPDLALRYGNPIKMKPEKDGSLVPAGINNDFSAARLGQGDRVVFIREEDAFYHYLEDRGIYAEATPYDLASLVSAQHYEVVKACADYPGIEKLEFDARQQGPVNGVVNRAKGILAKPSTFFDRGTEDVVACQNGLLKLDPLELAGFDPQYRLRTALSVRYDRDARCPTFEGVLRDALHDEDIELFQQCCGLHLLGVNRAQAIVCLIGTAGGSKGTIQEVITGLLGPGTVGTLRPKLLDTRFEVARLRGRTLAYGADVDPDFLDETAAHVLKSMTGGDFYCGELKFSNSRPETYLRINILITANSRLILRLHGGEDAAAWRRRLVIIPFSRPRPETVIRDLGQLLLRTEGSGILNWMLTGVQKLREARWSFQLTSRQQELVNDMVEESNSVSAFAHACLRKAQPSQCLTVTACYDKYLEHCTLRGWLPVSRRKFGGLLPSLVNRLGIHVRRDIPGEDGTDQQGFSGLECIPDPQGRTAQA